MGERTRVTSQRTGRLVAAIIVGILLGGVLLGLAFWILPLHRGGSPDVLFAFAGASVMLAYVSIWLSVPRHRGDGEKWDWRDRLGVGVSVAAFVAAVSVWISASWDRGLG